MVHFAYLGKENGIGKVAIIVLGATVVGVGCHSYFASPWVKKDVHKICDEIKNLTSLNPTVRVDTPCPNIGLEKYFVVATLFCFSLSFFGLIGNLFTKQMSNGFFKSVDMIVHGMSGILVIIAGSLYLYSAVKIDTLFSTIGDSVPCTSQLTANATYQLYEEKIAAGSLSIINGILYIAVAVLLLVKG